MTGAMPLVRALVTGVTQEVKDPAARMVCSDVGRGVQRQPHKVRPSNSSRIKPPLNSC
jgi:hypothetical protein